MNQLQGTKTEQNLLKAFAGESQYRCQRRARARARRPAGDTGRQGQLCLRTGPRSVDK